MKALVWVLLFSFFSCLWAYDGVWHFEAETGLTAERFETVQKAKNPDSFTAIQILKLNYRDKKYELFGQIYAQGAYYDTRSTQQQTKRSYIRLDELYAKYSAQNYEVQLGRSIRFWGALEAYNIVDTFNARDYRNGLSQKDKIGAENIAYSYFTDSGTLSFIVKFFEAPEPMAAPAYLFYFFPSFVSYDETLDTQKSPYNPTVYLKYTASTQWDNPLDYAFIVSHGYSGRRYFYTQTPQNLSALSPSFGQPTLFKERAYVATLFQSYETLLVKATLLKLELRYEQVEEDPNMGDSLSYGIGFEQTIESLFESEKSLGIIGEYYGFENIQSDKYDDLKRFEVYQNDLFLALRYSINDTANSSFLAGVMLDLEYEEYLFSAKYETHFDNAKLLLSYTLIEPSSSVQTAYAYIGRLEHVSVSYRYYF